MTKSATIQIQLDAPLMILLSYLKKCATCVVHLAIEMTFYLARYVENLSTPIVCNCLKIKWQNTNHIGNAWTVNSVKYVLQPLKKLFYCIVMFVIKLSTLFVWNHNWKVFLIVNGNARIALSVNSVALRNFLALRILKKRKTLMSQTLNSPKIFHFATNVERMNTKNPSVKSVIRKLRILTMNQSRKVQERNHPCLIYQQARFKRKRRRKVYQNICSNVMSVDFTLIIDAPVSYHQL